jgi:hypothetical protein
MEAIDSAGLRSQLCGVQAAVGWNRTKLGFSDSRNVLDQTLDSLLHLAVVFMCLLHLAGVILEKPRLLYVPNSAKF